jgi:hypothetical protein
MYYFHLWPIYRLSFTILITEFLFTWRNLQVKDCLKVEKWSRNDYQVSRYRQVYCLAVLQISAMFMVMRNYVQLLTSC